MTPAAALAALEAAGDATRAAQAAAYHKVARRYLGVPVPVITDITKAWRADLTLDDRLALSDALWRTDVHEARVASAKLLEQARIRPDDSGAWDLILSWLPDLDGWALADHAMIAGQKRVVWRPARIDTVEGWTTSPHLWTRRAALVVTLPWTRANHPSPADLAIRDRVLGWAAGYLDDRDWFIQKAVAWWLRDLSKHDPARVTAFLAAHGARMAPFARTEAARHLTGQGLDGPDGTA
jgi:3-methyladenine DNA glycosylase AlkD